MPLGAEQDEINRDKAAAAQRVNVAFMSNVLTFGGENGQTFLADATKGGE